MLSAGAAFDLRSLYPPFLTPLSLVYIVTLIASTLFYSLRFTVITFLTAAMARAFLRSSMTRSTSHSFPLPPDIAPLSRSRTTVIISPCSRSLRPQPAARSHPVRSIRSPGRTPRQIPSHPPRYMSPRHGLDPSQSARQPTSSSLSIQPCCPRPRPRPPLPYSLSKTPLHSPPSRPPRCAVTVPAPADSISVLICH